MSPAIIFLGTDPISFPEPSLPLSSGTGKRRPLKDLLESLLDWIKRFRQEGEVNSSDLADLMIMAIMTSRQTKRANAQNFRKWRRRLLLIQLFETDFSNYSSFKWYCIWISRNNYHRSFLRGKYILIITEKFRIKCI